jgi:hypothetical protein
MDFRKVFEARKLVGEAFISFRHFADNSRALLCAVVQIEQRTPFLDL